MLTTLLMSIFWIVYGTLGLFGIQVIPEKHRGTEYEMDYKRRSGLAWIMIGIPYLAAYFFLKNLALGLRCEVLVLIIIAVPGLIFSFLTDKKYNKKQ